LEENKKRYINEKAYQNVQVIVEDWPRITSQIISLTSPIVGYNLACRPRLFDGK
jgi:hypothetical protein